MVASDPDDPDRITRLLNLSYQGDTSAADELLRRLEAELRRMAASLMRKQPAGHTLQPTAIVNEAYMRVFAPGVSPPGSRHHFLCLIARAMRSVLVDHERKRRAVKRNEGARPAELDELVAAVQSRATDLLDLDEALEKLGELDPTLARVIELRFFAGLEMPQVAEALECSERGAFRKLKAARSWLATELEGKLPTEAD